MSGVRISPPVLTQTGVMKKIINYIKDSYNELVFKVSWPSRTELTSSAVIVMIASIMMALVVWGVDSVFDRVVKLFYGLL